MYSLLQSRVTYRPHPHTQFGAVLIGVLLAGALWGVSCMQTYEYFDHCSKDPWYQKIMVACVFCLDTLHQIFMSHVIYTYLVTQYSNPLYLGVVVWSLVAQVLVNALIGLIVQSFFTWRIWMLSRKKLICILPVVPLVITEFVLTLIYFVKGCSVGVFTKLSTLTTLSRAVNCVGFAGDILIAGILSVLLYNSKGGIARTDSLLNRLIAFSLSTGALTSLCALMSLIFISALPGTLIFITFYTPLGRLYTNSLLATLNARKKLRTLTSPSQTGPVVFDSFPVSALSERSGAQQQRHLALPVGADAQVKKEDGMSSSQKGGGEYELGVFGNGGKMV
ncbi:hypothetical protein B0H21DRAFT_746998 [Amylocystis lapponica]|nr:hypothetical protein B0H21DRAFT_746998 [Amylocystis lapponica]